jgi:effector-associated domain 2 (EAD2)-containing protein/TIR domain-containing protein
MGGVFINYRSVDDPMAAASIYQWLATRFGEHQVFRDCVTLDAGTHYPTGIRSALENAAVVIAVIGPRWLTLTDPETGVRLIDRKEDWVRQEIATAFRRDIPVLPVLLKDTPENARHPTPAELPDDIRRLGTIQALAISQRTLGPDLERLAAALVRLVPTLAFPTPTREVFRSLVDALEAVPCLLNEDTRALFVSRLRSAIAGGVRYSPQRRAFAINVIRTCLDYEGGLAEMIATIREIEGADSVPLQRLVAITRQLPAEFAG